MALFPGLDLAAVINDRSSPYWRIPLPVFPGDRQKGISIVQLLDSSVSPDTQVGR